MQTQNSFEFWFLLITCIASIPVAVLAILKINESIDFKRIYYRFIYKTYLLYQIPLIRKKAVRILNKYMDIVENEYNETLKNNSPETKTNLKIKRKEFCSLEYRLKRLTYGRKKLRQNYIVSPEWEEKSIAILQNFLSEQKPILYKLQDGKCADCNKVIDDDGAIRTDYISAEVVRINSEKPVWILKKREIRDKKNIKLICHECDLKLSYKKYTGSK